MKYTISEIVVDLLRIYSDFDYEVGGLLFANEESEIVTVSFKKGSSVSVSFNQDDSKLHYGIENTKVVGTWHLHPKMSFSPSGQDKRQWKDWKNLDIHIICNDYGFKVYNSRGEGINEGTFQKL